jgi:hypothetical protein
MKSTELIKELNHFLSGSTTSDELKDWVFAHLQDALDRGDPDTIRRIEKVNVSLMELSDQAIDGEGFLQSIDSVVRESETFVLPWDPAKEHISEVGIGVDDETIENRATLNWQVIDLSLQGLVLE